MSYKLASKFNEEFISKIFQPKEFDKKNNQDSYLEPMLILDPIRLLADGGGVE